MLPNHCLPGYARQMASHNVRDGLEWPFDIGDLKEFRWAAPAPGFVIAWDADADAVDLPGGFLIPRAFFFFLRDYRGTGRDVGLKVTFENGALVCDQVVIARGSGRAIQTPDLRIPLKRLLRAAGVRTIWRKAADGGLDYVFPSDPDAAHLGDLLTGGGGRPRRGVRLPDEHLRAVATEYRKAVAGNQPPNQVISERMSTTYSNATRWVALARQRVDPETGEPFLGPAMPGLPGEERNSDGQHC